MATSQSVISFHLSWSYNLLLPSLLSKLYSVGLSNTISLQFTTYFLPLASTTYCNSIHIVYTTFLLSVCPLSTDLVKQRRSWIWSYFSRMSGTLAQCKLCQRTICHGGNATGNMNRHLKMVHNKTAGETSRFNIIALQLDKVVPYLHARHAGAVQAVPTYHMPRMKRDWQHEQAPRDDAKQIRR